MLLNKLTLVVNRILSVFGIDGTAQATLKDYLIVAGVCTVIGIFSLYAYLNVDKWFDKK